MPNIQVAPAQIHSYPSMKNKLLNEQTLNKAIWIKFQMALLIV